MSKVPPGISDIYAAVVDAIAYGRLSLGDAVEFTSAIADGRWGILLNLFKVAQP